MRWAQSANEVFIEVKYAMRMDSPACLDIFDQNIQLLNQGQFLIVEAMCRNVSSFGAYVKN